MLCMLRVLRSLAPRAYCCWGQTGLAVCSSVDGSHLRLLTQAGMLCGGPPCRMLGDRIDSFWVRCRCVVAQQSEQACCRPLAAAALL